ncbi:methyltransferase, FxLD system [Natronosporangium hydrolyticum]|uniref:Protein-L-isoaspartate O-methyltransferase n=2 Tax=Natronosporangium hydrolyticum TaxID=2811111 RepID=A0A895Y9A2_9ACTN|nr:methyltransferase, FxLD system [Natronosporangium hydrolyticum]
MVDGINSWQPLSEPVAAAMRQVPRHLFVPDASLEEAYSNSTVVTRRDQDGIATSSSTGPGLMGAMLDQLQLRPGMPVLEIGAGTGYNAALLAALVGPAGHVTAVEITPEVADDARAALTAAGVTNAEIVCGDGEYGHRPNAPYDRIIATAGAWELPQSWGDQLAEGGVLVAPLRIKGLTRSVALTRDPSGVWRSHSALNCGFMPIRGRGAMPERNIRLAEDLTVRFDDGQDVDADELRRVASPPGEVRWSRVLIDRPLDLLDLYLAELDGFCRVLASASVTERGLIEPVAGWGSMGAATRQALGYLTKRTSLDNQYLDELGVCAYGPAAASMLDQLTERVDRWRRTREAIAGVRIEIHPPGRGEVADALMTVEKRHSRVVVRPRQESERRAPQPG